MKLRTLNCSTIIFYCLFELSFGKTFSGMLKFPFLKFKMNHKEFNSLILNLSCEDKFSNIKECAEQCYYRGNNSMGCVAFTKIKASEECYICNSGDPCDINSNKTKINENNVDLIYILKYKKKKPVIYLPLEADDIRGTTVIGNGINGTLMWAYNTRIQTGKVNQGLYVEHGGRLVLDNSINKCFGNLNVCTNGLSIALWVKPSSMGGNGRHITHGEQSINIQIKGDGTIAVWSSGQSKTIHNLVTQSIVPLGTWTHVSVVFDPDIGMFIYMNGILDAFKSIDEAFSLSSPYGPHDYVFGSKAHGGHSFQGTMDEIKVFYNSLSSADIWREYASYEISLKTEKSWNVTVKKLPRNKNITFVHTEWTFRKDEMAVIRTDAGDCTNSGNQMGWFVHHSKVTNGCKIYRGHTGALWSENQTLTSGGCSWWYIP